MTAIVPYSPQHTTAQFELHATVINQEATPFITSRPEKCPRCLARVDVLHTLVSGSTVQQSTQP